MKYKQAILILTNGNFSSDEVSESTMLRLNKIMDLDIAKNLIITSTAFTVNKEPFLDQNLFPVFESYTASEYLQNELNIPINNIVSESFSRDTIGNIYLSLVTIIIPMGIKEIKIITSEFHLERVKICLNWISSIFAPKVKFKLFPAPNPKYNSILMKQLIKKEISSISNIKLLKKRIKTKKDFINWFFHEHKAYTFYNKPKILNSQIKKTY
jgi:uncharacterized SAM-binding protein YcdF (DUF218 family)